MKFNSHELVCIERYSSILQTHKDIKESQLYTNKLLVGLGLSILGGMAMILVFQLFRVNIV